VKIGFTLTYAEFLDAHETQQGEANHSTTTAAVAAYIVVALACLAFGLWTGFNSPLKPFEGSRVEHFHGTMSSPPTMRFWWIPLPPLWIVILTNPLIVR